MGEPCRGYINNLGERYDVNLYWYCCKEKEMDVRDTVCIG